MTGFSLLTHVFGYQRDSVRLLEILIDRTLSSIGFLTHSEKRYALEWPYSDQGVHGSVLLDFFL